MPKDVTVTFKDGSTHVYKNAPDNVTPDEVEARASKEFGKPVASLSRGGNTPQKPDGYLERVGNAFTGAVRKIYDDDQVRQKRDAADLKRPLLTQIADAPRKLLVEGVGDTLAGAGNVMNLLGAPLEEAALPAGRAYNRAWNALGLHSYETKGVPQLLGGKGVTHRRLTDDEADRAATNDLLTAAGMVLPAKAGPRLPGPLARAPKGPSVRTQQVRALQDMGVKLTPGQIAGGIIQNAEDAVATTSSAVRNAKMRANVGLNEGVINDALAPIKGSVKGAGREAIESMHTQIGEALDASFGSAKFSEDATLRADVSRASRKLLTTSRKEATRAVKEFIEDAKTPGGLSEAFANLNAKKAEASASNQKSLADFIQNLQTSILDSLDRTSGTNVSADIRAARDAFRRSIVPETAAAKVGAEGGVPTAEQLFSAVRVADRTVRKNAFAQGKAQYQGVAEAAKNVMGKTIGSSGTAERKFFSDPIGFVVIGARNLALRGIYNEPVIAALNQISRAKSPQMVTQGLNKLSALAAKDPGAAKALQALAASQASAPSAPYSSLPAAAGTREETRPKARER